MELGIEHFIKKYAKNYIHTSVGVLCHQASVTQKLHFTPQVLIEETQLHIQALFSPQHGLFGEKQANMIESADGWDRITKLPVISLYARHRKPSSNQLKNIELMLIDLQDVGTRVYTFIYTMALMLMACKEKGIPVLVLDRPNPIGGKKVEGNLLDPEFSSFVGMFPIVMRHGMTIGELAQYFNIHFQIHADLTVIPMKKWNRELETPQLNLSWVNPSPNMPSYEAALMYPGMVLFEGTNISEGRGTTHPFAYLGAPFLKPSKILDMCYKPWLQGCYLRTCAFEPTFDKYAYQVCHGFQIHVTDPALFQPYRVALTLLKSIRLIHSKEFNWLTPPYEYEYTHLPFDILTGNQKIRAFIDGYYSELEMEEWFHDHERIFILESLEYYLYS